MGTRPATTWVKALVIATALAFAVGRAWALGAPSQRGIFPASGVVGTTVTATVTGAGLAGATAAVYGEMGLAVGVQSATDTTVSLQLQIDAGAVPGERIISLTTPGGTVALAFTVNPAGGPIVSGVSPTPTATQGFGLGLVVTGQNLASLGADNLTVTGNGVSVGSVGAAPDGTRLDVSLLTAPDAGLGTHALVIASPGGGATLQLYVQRPAPTITAVSPGAGEIGRTTFLTIAGSHLTGAALVITSGSSGQGGVTVSDVATPDDGTLTATLTFAPTLSPETEPRLLIVTTESGQATEQFFVVAAGLPSLTSARPGAGEPNRTVGVTLRGSNLTGATLSTGSASLTLQNAVVVDDETITLSVVVAAGATPNTNHTITATVGASTANVTFRVIAPNAPFIGAVRPPFGNRGATIAVILDGANLSSVVAGSGVDLAGPKIVESNAQALDANTVRAILTIDPTASVGGRDVTVTTTSGSFTKPSSFRVNVPGQVPTISDVSPRAVSPGTTTAITVTGSNFLDAGVTVGGPGSVVSGVIVGGGGTTVTFDLTLPADATAENRPLIVVTENGSATVGILSLAPAIELRAAQLVTTGAAFEVLTAGFRLFVFEFSINERFEPGLRTSTVATGGPTLALTRLQAENVGRAVRDLPFVYARVRGVTATNQLATSATVRLRR